MNANGNLRSPMRLTCCARTCSQLCLLVEGFEDQQFLVFHRSQARHLGLQFQAAAVMGDGQGGGVVGLVAAGREERDELGTRSSHGSWDSLQSLRCAPSNRPRSVGKSFAIQFTV